MKMFLIITKFTIATTNCELVPKSWRMNTGLPLNNIEADGQRRHIPCYMFRNTRTPTITETSKQSAPFLDRPNSHHDRGLVTWVRTFWNCSLVSSNVPELSMTISALVRFQSSGVCALILFLACSSEIPSLAISRWSWVSGSTQTTIMGFAKWSILASNNNGMSRTITLDPLIHSFTISQKMP